MSGELPILEGGDIIRKIILGTEIAGAFLRRALLCKKTKMERNSATQVLTKGGWQ